MKKVVGFALCATIFTVGAAAAKKKRLAVSFSDTNKADEVSRYLGTYGYLDELPSAGDYTSTYGLRGLVDALSAEYKELVEADYERCLALNYAELEEEELMAAMSFADGLSKLLRSYISLLEEKIARYTEWSAVEYEQARLKDEQSALKLKDAWDSRKRSAGELMQDFIDKKKRLEPLRTPR